MSAWWLLVLPGLSLGLTLFNLLVWPRGRTGRFSGTVSVLIPARNEERHLEAALAALEASRHPIDEIWVYDDASTDQTPAILERWRDRAPRLRVLRGQGLPPGWVGKSHACHRLAEAASGDHLLFLDADVVLAPDGLARIAELMGRYQAQVLTAVPHQVMGSTLERWVMPLLHLSYTSWLPLPLIWRSSNPRFLAANGQVLCVERSSYQRLGGFEAVRSEVVDDMAFCRRAKTLGAKVVFADGERIARCRMYQSGREVIDGFSKNLYEGVGGHPLALASVLLLYFAAFVLPFLALLLSVQWPILLGPALASVGANLLVRSLLALRFGHHLSSVLVHPLGVLALIGIGLNSYRWHRRGRIEWRGRSYGPRATRQALETDPS